MRPQCLILLSTVGLLQSLLCQSVYVERADRVAMRGSVDSNSPAHWYAGKRYLYNSSGMPVRLEGTDVLRMTGARAVMFDKYDRVARWIESVWQDTDGTLYAWYHYEPGNVCQGNYLTAPQIGAAVSTDHGVSFRDLGIVISSPFEPNCDAKNGYFATGNGDFSVILDREKNFFYFYFSHYGGDSSKQGVAVARMRFEDRRDPIAHVNKYFKGDWNEPGIDGDLTPVLPASVSWASENADAYWGPSVHWNRYLGKFVMLLNRSCCDSRWPQEGIYISYFADLSDPLTWSTPQKILDTTSWYPQVMGDGGIDTDTSAGQSPRLYVGGESRWKLVFSK